MDYIKVEVKLSNVTDSYSISVYDSNENLLDIIGYVENDHRTAKELILPTSEFDKSEDTLWNLDIIYTHGGSSRSSYKTVLEARVSSMVWALQREKSHDTDMMYTAIYKVCSQCRDEHGNKIARQIGKRVVRTKWIKCPTCKGSGIK